MPKEQRYYGAGPLVGKPIQEYPKMLYRSSLEGREETKVVADEGEHQAAQAEGWGERQKPTAERAAEVSAPEAETGSDVSQEAASKVALDEQAPVAREPGNEASESDEAAEK